MVPGGVDRSGTHRVIPALLWLIERLARVHDLQIFALRQEPEPSRYRLLGASVINIGRRATMTRLGAALRTEHRHSAFAVLHVFWGGRHAALVVSLARLLKLPVVLHLAGGELARIPAIDFGGYRWFTSRLALHLTARAASAVTAPSALLVAVATARNIKVERLPLGVDLERWPLQAPRPRTDVGPARLIHVADLNRVKDQATLLRALEVLRHEGVAFRLDVAGTDTLGGRVQRFAQELGLEQLIRFHGFLPHRKLRQLVERAHLHVLSSRYEAGGIAVLEAAAAGVPTVGTEVGHIAEFAPEGAVAVPVGDWRALGSALQLVLADDELRLRLARRAQELVAREDADWTARRVCELYEDLVGESR